MPARKAKRQGSGGNPGFWAKLAFRKNEVNE
jgi:hypothetical protein